MNLKWSAPEILEYYFESLNRENSAFNEAGVNYRKPSFFSSRRECFIRRAARIAAGRVMLTNFLLRHEQASGASDEQIKDIESDAEAFYIPHICRGAEIRWSASLAFLSLTHNCYSDGLQKRAEGVIMQLQ